MNLPERLEADVTEAAFGRYIEAAARERGWLCCHVRPLKVPRRNKFITPASPGFPDYVLAHPGWPRVLFLEIKAAGNKPTASQKRWLSVLARCPSVDAWWALPEHWPRIVAYLDGPGRSAG